ncbi:MAG: electron transfer flavoprotein subunit beta/FixA family protein [Thermoplasmataceae archaeon]
MPYNVIVLIKQIPDIDQMKTNPGTGEPLLQNVPLRMENLSKNAAEAAVRIKEKNGGKVTVLCFGTEKSTSVMKEAYAMGADEGYLITGYLGNHPSVTANALVSKIKEIPHDLVILGNQSADSYTGLLPGSLSALLGEPLLGNAIDIKIQEKQVSVVSALEENNLEIATEMPAVVSVAQEINQPRLPPVLQIMAAGRKPINQVALSDVKVPEVKTISNKAPKSDRKRIVFEDPAKGIEEVSNVIREAIR